VAGLVDAVAERLGPVDILILNAGVNVRKETPDLQEEDWDFVIDTNLKGAFLVAQQVLPGMRERAYGRVVLLGSILSFVSVAGRAAYSSSKAAVLGLTRTLALEGAKDDVCVNAICPGPFDTPMNVALTEDPKTRAEFAARIPVGRWGDPQDLRGLTLLLCSPACQFITGSSYLIDGGWTAQ
jgi:NAD(P)-dependent dehydrogenase (short-subunit alcohol dehydrogenase family)